MGCFHMVYRTEFCSAFVSIVGQALAAEHTVGALLCLVHQILSHAAGTPNKHGTYSQ